MITDDEGNFTVLFTVLDSQRDAVANTDLLPMESIRFRAGDTVADLEQVELNEPNLSLLRDYPAGIRIVILLPNTRQFTGSTEDAGYPDHFGLRGALMEALESLPQRENIAIEVGVFNTSASWLPRYNSTPESLRRLRADLQGTDWIAEGTAAFQEDPFAAINAAFNRSLRRQARDQRGDFFVTFFLIISNGSPLVDEGGELGDLAQSAQTRLSSADVADVVTLTTVYVPDHQDQFVTAPNGDPYSFAVGVTPESGTFRLTGNAQGIRRYLEQVINEINYSMVLQFNNDDLEPDTNLYFDLAVTPSGGPELSSNAISASVQERSFNLWGTILKIGLIIIGLLLLIILIVWLIKRPKKEVVEEVVVEEQVQLCVQCGRGLRGDLQYCHHCAAEPNYGLIKVLEGPEAGWTFFIRDIATELGTAMGNSIRVSDPGVSGNHIRITVQDGRRYLIEDLKSSNGTYIEGARVDKQYLKNGDVIVVGASTKLKFTIS